ncbi:MAG TPA: SDR family oxidoreductase [Pirellulaceae bacterium]|nr:SDR family oxidoreductase [Pirellulaceae bacterium]HMO91294.1 SDR family oxidoreductase [Pirellulaceae bacterium]HMP68522.1 SDR family oxidoreductase [Pirellulaceae bacterium]
MSVSPTPPDQALESAVCLITGGSSGVGLATAAKFVAEGCAVAICARNINRLTAAYEHLRGVTADADVLAITADLNQPLSLGTIVQQVMERWGRIDTLVNNAAVAPLAPLDETTDDAFEQVVNVNIRSVFYLTRAVWTIMERQKSGTIINLSSLAAVDPFPGFSVYGSSKAWIELFTTALSNEGRDCGINVFAVRAGTIETPLLRGLFPDFPAEQTLRPEQVAEVIWSLSQPAMAPASGQAIMIKR